MYKDFWDTRFQQQGYIYGVKPNQFFADFIASREPTKILLPAEGEGRNAVYAAKLGWTVDAFDYSEPARRKAFALAEQHQVTINYVLANLESVVLDVQYDVIGLIHAHLPDSLRREVHRKLIRFLKPGGYIVLEGFSKEQPRYNSGGPKLENFLYDLTEVKEDFSSLIIEQTGEAERVLDEGIYHQGLAHVVQLVGRKPLVREMRDASRRIG